MAGGVGVLDDEAGVGEDFGGWGEYVYRRCCWGGEGKGESWEFGC